MAACDCCGDTLPDTTGVPIYNTHGPTGAVICHGCVSGPALCQWQDCTLEATNQDWCGEHFRRQRNRAIAGRAPWLGWD